MNFSFKSLLPPADLGWNRVRAKCAHLSCHNKLLMRAMPQSRSGIHVGERWFCSPDCFAAGSSSMLLPLTRSSVVQMPRNPRLTLGLAMLSKGFLTAEQLHFAADRSNACGETMETVLMRYGLATEKQIAAARALQWGHPVILRDLTESIVHADLPRSILEQCSAVPLHSSESAKRLVVGFVERVDHDFLQSVEQITGHRPEPCFITKTEFRSISEQMTVSPEYREIIVDHRETVDQIARTLGGFAVDVKAREASITRCKASIWARLSGKTGVVDIIFPVRETKRISTAAPRNDPFGFAIEGAARG